MGLICVSLMINDAEYLFMCLFAICISSSVKIYLSKSFVLLGGGGRGAALTARGSSQARDQSRDTGVAYATAAAMRDP